MGWLDAFTGAAAKKASGAQVAALREANQMSHWGGDEARQQLIGNAIPEIEQGYGNALSALQQYYPEAQGYAGQATAAYAPMTAYGKTGVDAYQSAMGLGPEGAAGMNAFQNTPGYQFARDQGLDAVMRSASAQGLLASGNTSADLAKYATGLADQTYGSYLSRLNPLMSMYGTGIAGQASGLTNQANLASGMGTNTANLHKGMGQDMANIYGQAGQTYLDEARSRAGILGQIGQAQAGGILGAANAQGNTIMSGLNLVSKLAGGFV
jgi:hypothetical protein